MRRRLASFTLSALTAAAIPVVGSGPVISYGGEVALALFLGASVERGDVRAVIAIVVSSDGVAHGGAFGEQDVAATNMRRPARFSGSRR